MKPGRFYRKQIIDNNNQIVDYSKPIPPVKTKWYYWFRKPENLISLASLTISICALSQIQEIKGFTSLLSKTDTVMNNTDSTNRLLREAVAELTKQVRKSDEQSTYLESSVSLLAMQIPLLTEQLQSTRISQQRAILLEEQEKKLNINKLYYLVKDWRPTLDYGNIMNRKWTTVDSMEKARVMENAYNHLKEGLANPFLISNDSLMQMWIETFSYLQKVRYDFTLHDLLAKSKEDQKLINNGIDLKRNIHERLLNALAQCVSSRNYAYEITTRANKNLYLSDSLGTK